MNDTQQDSQANGTRARIADICLIAALFLVFVVSWKDLSSNSPDLHQAARQAMTQHVEGPIRGERIGQSQFVDPTALHANTAD